MSPVMLAQAPNLSRRPEIRHGFTSRAGGVSTGPLDSLNLSARPHEVPDALTENWRRVASALDPSLGTGAVAVLNQVHGADVVRVEGGLGPLQTLADADGAFTTRAGVVLGVRVADCVPVLFAGPSVIGIAHAGWRGVVGDVASKVLAAMQDATGAPAGSFAAAIGPCISGPAFEVGDEVVEGLRAADVPEEVYLHGASAAGRALVDLAAVVAFQLRRSGLLETWVDGRCTTRSAELWSHRRDGAAAGRFAGVIARVR
jgi:polyphenol oxidase